MAPDEDEEAPAAGTSGEGDADAVDDPLDDDRAPKDARKGEEPGGARPPEDEARVRGRLEQFIPELVRRTILAGLGAVFTTEEGIRKLASEIPLPKELAAFLIQQAGSSKDELFRIFARELRSFLESANLAGEMQKLLT